MYYKQIVPIKKKKKTKKQETPEERRQREAGKIIWLNEKTKIDVSNPTQVANLILDGQSGGGKSYALGVIANQFKDVVLFDVIGGVEKTLKEQGVFDEWKHYSLGYKAQRKTNLIKINVSSLCSIKILSILKDEWKTQRGARARKYFKEFFMLPPSHPKKNYQEFARLCEATHKEVLLEELDAILSPTDDGLKISEFLNGKKIINTESIEQENRSVPILMNSFFYHRTRGMAETKRKRKKANPTHENLPENRLLIGVDDAQMTSSVFKRTIGNLFSLARKYNISALVAGTNLGELSTQTKANANILLLFNAKFDEDAIRNKLGLYDVDFYSLSERKQETGEKGWCIFSIRDHPFYSKPRIVRPNLFYLQGKPVVEESVATFDTRELYGKLRI